MTPDQVSKASSKRQREIMDSAEAHGGVYHLPRRFPRQRLGREFGQYCTDVDRDYSECQTLVDKGMAVWLPNYPAIRVDATAATAFANVCREVE